MKTPENTQSRRRFLGKAALGCAAGAGLLSASALVRSVIPALSRSNKVFSVGQPSDYPVNSFTLLPEHKVYIIRDHEGVRAVSAVCSHLGCVLKRNENEFQCPCHGSRFDDMGHVLSGPAPSPLPWFKVDLALDGQLRVDIIRRVSSREVFKVQGP